MSLDELPKSVARSINQRAGRIINALIGGRLTIPEGLENQLKYDRLSVEDLSEESGPRVSITPEQFNSYIIAVLTRKPELLRIIPADVLSYFGLSKPDDDHVAQPAAD